VQLSRPGCVSGFTVNVCVCVCVNGGYDFQKDLPKVWDYVTSTACHVQYCLVFQLSIFGVVNGVKKNNQRVLGHQVLVPTHYNCVYHLISFNACKL